MSSMKQTEQDGVSATLADIRTQYKASKALTERLWYALHRDRISRKRKERYRNDALYREKVLARKKAAWKTPVASA